MAIKMSKYLLETHAHTKEVSTCGKMCAADVVENYIKAGYNGIVITDHMSLETYDSVYFNTHQDISWDNMVNDFLIGYNSAKEAAKGRMDVFFGMELRVSIGQPEYNNNDYLVYGITPDILREMKHPYSYTLKNAVEFLHGHNCIVVQAHPFRNEMVITPPGIIDGVEVFNGSPRHDARNNIAELWADMFSLIKTSGSDYHGEWSKIKGGIIFKSNIKDEKDLVEALKSKQYELYNKIQCAQLNDNKA